MTAADAERDYLLRRRAQHIGLASGCADPAQQALHLRFAALYQERAEDESIVQAYPTPPQTYQEPTDPG